MSWEQYAPTSEPQLARLARLRELCGGDVAESGPAPMTMGLAAAMGGSGKSTTIAALYQTYLDADFMENDALGAEAATRALQLRHCASSCGALADRVARALELLDGIDSQQAQASEKTRALHSTCERLLKEQTDLAAQVGLLAKPLEYFDALEVLAPQFGMPISMPRSGSSNGGSSGIGRSGASSSSATTARAGVATLHPGSEEFLAALERIDECATFLEAHPEYKDSALYHAKYVELRARALALVKNQVVEYLEQAARVASEQPVTAGRLELSAVYSRFRAISHRVSSLVNVIRRHAGDGPLRSLVEECERSYLEKRLALTRPPVRQHLDGLSNVRELVACVRFGAAYLIRLGQLESRLYDSCMGAGPRHGGGVDESKGSFAGGDTASVAGSIAAAEDDLGSVGASSYREDVAGLYDMLLALCEELYMHLRPRMLTGNDMNELCEVVGVVREEIVEEHRGRHGRAQARRRQDGTGGEVVAIETVLTRLVQDAQERLIHLALKAIRFEIAGFQPRPDQLDYPAILVVQHATAAAAAAAAGGNDVDRGPGSSGVGNGDGGQAQAAAEAALSAYNSWYPPLRSALMLLSKVYRAVDMAVFEDLAHQAVAATTQRLHVAAMAITKTSSGLNGQLFLIKHLLTLREQLLPFDVSFAHRSTQLNFGATRAALRKFVTTAPALFRLDKDNSLVRVSVESLPTVDEFQVDAKRDMEETLKAACSEFIALVADNVREPLTTFLCKARAFRLDSSSAVPLTPTAAGAAAPAGVPAGVDQRLQAQPFAQPERVCLMLGAVCERAAEYLPQVTQAMTLYIANDMTEGVLFHPIQKRVVDVAHDVADVLQRIYSAEEYREVAPLFGQLSDIIMRAGPPRGPRLTTMGSVSSLSSGGGGHGTGHGHDKRPAAPDGLGPLDSIVGSTGGGGGRSGDHPVGDVVVDQRGSFANGE